jgi:putative copper resistance protein D
MAGNAVILAQLPELTGGRLLSSWQLDVPALLLVIVLGALYGWGMARLRRRGEPWPPGRPAPVAQRGGGGQGVATKSRVAL